MYHNSIDVNIAFNSFRNKIIQKLGAKTYLLFFHATGASSQNIVIYTS